jgi:hypothetical protein
MSNKESDPEFLKMESILYTLAKLFSEIQQALDRKSLDLAHEVLEFDNIGFSLKDNCMIRYLDSASDNTDIEALPLLSLISFQRYQISELVIEFAIIEKDHYSDKFYDQDNFYLVQGREYIEKCRNAKIIIFKEGNVFAEFQIDGETKETLVL